MSCNARDPLDPDLGLDCEPIKQGYGDTIKARGGLTAKVSGAAAADMAKQEIRQTMMMRIITYITDKMEEVGESVDGPCQWPLPWKHLR